MRKGRLAIVLIILACVISRLPQLLSDNLVLDGDECVVALMAKHIYHGKEFPLFFYGQAYGFSLIECLAIVPFYALMGVSTVSTKLGMLMLWTTGCVFMHKAFTFINKTNAAIPLLVILVFIFCPAWAVWSMKARGGYLTSFLLTSMLLYFLYHEKMRHDTMKFFIMGGLLALIYESQPLWIPGLVPLLLYEFYKERNWAKTIAFLLSASLLAFAFHFYIKGLPDSFAAHPFVASKHELLSNVRTFLYHLYGSLHGNYYLWFMLKPSLSSNILAILFVGVIFFLLFAGLYNFVKKKEGTTFFSLSVLAILFTLVPLLFCRSETMRYFLPVTGYTLLSLILFLQTINAKMKQVYSISYLVMIVGGFSVISFKDYKVSWLSERNVHDVVDRLISKDVHFVCTCSFLLPFYINFYSDEQVICRDVFFPGRYPPYTEKVDSALNNHVKTAFIGYDNGDYCGMNANLVEHFENFYIIEDVPKSELAKSFSFQ